MKKIVFVVLISSLYTSLPALAEQHGPGPGVAGEDIVIMDAPFSSGVGILSGVMATPVHGGGAFANYSMGSPGLMFGRLFTPAMIMRNQEKLNLSSKQTDAIKMEMRTFQSGIVDIQWDLNSATASLQKALAADKIDTDLTLKLVDSVLKAENKLKKMHLALLIEIHNALDTKQIATLRKSTHTFFMGHGSPMPMGDVMINEAIHMEP